uniref:Predicted protein n=1 Tax=Physcomitrium patens TaxID=3218 RepID=A9U564_PHYPA
MEEKKQGNFDDIREGNSSKRQTRGNKAREAVSQELPIKDTSALLEEKTKEPKDKDKDILQHEDEFDMDRKNDEEDLDKVLVNSWQKQKGPIPYSYQSNVKGQFDPITETSNQGSSMGLLLSVRLDLVGQPNEVPNIEALILFQAVPFSMPFREKHPFRGKILLETRIPGKHYRLFQFGV